MNHEIFEDLLIAALSRSLSMEEQKQLTNHLQAGCALCDEMRESLAQVTSAMLSTASEQPLPPRLKEKIFAEIEPKSAPQRSSMFKWAFALAATVIFAVIVPRFVNQPAIVGEIQNIQGDIFINNKKVSEHATLRAGESLTTATGSSAELKLSDRVRAKVKEDSQLYVENKLSGFDVHMSRGAILSMVKSGTAYAVVTPALKAEARGTGFFMKVNSPQQTYVCICSGHIFVSHKTFSQDLESPHHKALIVSPGVSSVKTEPGPLIDHSDAEIADFASRF